MSQVESVPKPRRNRGGRPRKPFSPEIMQEIMGEGVQPEESRELAAKFIEEAVFRRKWHGRQGKAESHRAIRKAGELSCLYPGVFEEVYEKLMNEEKEE